MELRKSRWSLVTAALGLGCFVLLVPSSLDSPRRILYAVIAVFGLVMFVAGIARTLRPFQFRIGPDGLDVRSGKLRRLVGWHEIDAVVLVQQPTKPGTPTPDPRLLLVPAAGVDLGVPLTETSPVDDRPAVALLDLGQVREKPDAVAGAFAQHGGSRFVDLRAATVAGAPEFIVVLRGYDRPEVDAVVQRVVRALHRDTPADRADALAAVEQATFTVVVRGYDRAAVEAYLEQAKALLAEPA